MGGCSVQLASRSYCSSSEAHDTKGGRGSPLPPPPSRLGALLCNMLDTRRPGKCYRHWHADLRSDDSPLEAGLAFTCKLKSDIPFLGREAMEAQRAAGIFRRLVCFTIDEKLPLFGLEAIWRNGRVVGHVRRADFGHAINRSVAYGYICDPEGMPVSLEFVKTGEYKLERMGVSYPAKAHTKSLFDPENKRVKGIY
ncbi:Sarcosine dehydrogenase, mitochondrial [Varanus komodoensis]|nr:Sarcosine dehydrogenase, mitochondrial [Varanus komodoensis]